MQSSEAIIAERVYWRFRTDVFDVQNVPENVWIRIMTFCDLRDLLSLEQACTFHPNPQPPPRDRLTFDISTDMYISSVSCFQSTDMD